MKNQRERRAIRRMVCNFYDRNKRWPTEDDFVDGEVTRFVREYGSFEKAVNAGRQSDTARKQKRHVLPGIKSTDAMWRRLPGSFEMGKRR